MLAREDAASTKRSAAVWMGGKCDRRTNFKIEIHISGGIKGNCGAVDDGDDGASAALASAIAAPSSVPFSFCAACVLQAVPCMHGGEGGGVCESKVPTASTPASTPADAVAAAADASNSRLCAGCETRGGVCLRNRSAICITVTTTSLCRAWCSQCRVGLQPARAARANRRVAWHTGRGASQDGTSDAIRSKAACASACCGGSTTPFRNAIAASA